MSAPNSQRNATVEELELVVARDYGYETVEELKAGELKSWSGSLKWRAAKLIERLERELAEAKSNGPADAERRFGIILAAHRAFSGGSDYVKNEAKRLCAAEVEAHDNAIRSRASQRSATEGRQG